MKKILSLIFCMILCLCSCNNNSEISEEAVDIPFQKIAATNNRTKLLEKFSCISERTASRPGGGDYSYWTMYFEKDAEKINAILDYSIDYKCYYYDGNVYAEYGDGEVRTVLPYREDYDRIMSNLLARTDTLSYVFITESNAVKIEDGFEAEYDFIVNNDILPELEGLGVKVGDKVRVKYELDENLIINKCKYYMLAEEKNIEVARIDITYDEKRLFPESIVNLSENDEYVTVNVIEDFGTGSEYRESFNVKKGSYISENDVLMQYYLFKDPVYQIPFETFSEKVEKNQDIFIIDSAYADILVSRQEYYEGLEKEEAADSE